LTHHDIQKQEFYMHRHGPHPDKGRDYFFRAMSPRGRHRGPWGQSGDWGDPREWGGRRRRMGRGDVRAAMLVLLEEQSHTGYSLMEELERRSGGTWRPSPGSVYPTLSQLEDEGLVRVEQADGRRVVHLTEEGTRYVEEHRAELDAVWESVDRGDDDATALIEQLGQLHAAAHQVISAGTPAQITAATEALTEARKTIYRLLAE
jgi:DNA-binding PadR family transcriptional regulator